MTHEEDSTAVISAIRTELVDWHLWVGRALVLAFAALAGLTVVLFTWLTERAFAAFEHVQRSVWWLPLLWTPLCTAAIVWLMRRYAMGSAGSGIAQVMAAIDTSVTPSHRSLFVSLTAIRWIPSRAVPSGTTQAPTAAPAVVPAATAQVLACAASPGHAHLPPCEPVQPKRGAHYLWAVLIARIYEVFPLLCPVCGGQTHLIACITHSADIRLILGHIEVGSALPRITPVRRPPLRGDCGARKDHEVQIQPDWHLAAQPATGFEADQRI